MNDHSYMKMALKESALSHDPSTKVGAVLVSPDQKTVVSGHNRFPAGIPDREDWWANRDDARLEFTKYDLACCAEMDAILKARCDLEGWVLYSTHFPCLNCAKAIAHVGISRVVYGVGPEAVQKGIDGDKVRRLLELAGVSLASEGSGAMTWPSPAMSGLRSTHERTPLP